MEQVAYASFLDQIVDAIWRDLDPLVEQIEETEQLPNDVLFPLLREMGAFSLLMPVEVGGLGLTIEQYVPIIAEFAKVHGGIRVVVHVHNSMGHALARCVQPNELTERLKGYATGHGSVAFALTEPDHGTGNDVGTEATRDGNSYVINGRKWLITNSDFASHFMVICKVDGKPSIILVERDLPGFTIEPLPELMGCKGGAHGLLTFDNVRVGVENLLGSEGAGLALMEETLEISRVLVAASSLGAAEYALALSVEHARTRKTFGKPIAERQAVQRYLAEMAVDVQAMRLLIFDAAQKYDRGQRIPSEASISKLFSLEAVGRVTDRALLVHGGIGYTRRHPIERLYRDARLNWLEEGTPTIQQLVIARELLAAEPTLRALAPA